MPQGGQPGSSGQPSSSASGGQQGQGSNPGGQAGQAGQQPGNGSGGSSPSGAGNQPGTGQNPGGSGVQNPVGGGGNNSQGGDPGNPQGAKDETQPTSPAQEANNPFGGDDVAPKGAEQSGLTLRGLSDALKDAEFVKELEQRTGATKEQLEQFAKAYEKQKVGPGREAQDVEVKVGEHPAVGPGTNLPGAGVTRFNTDKIRGRGLAPDQAKGGMAEGNRDEPPPEFRERYYRFKSKLGRAPRAKAKAN